MDFYEKKIWDRLARFIPAQAVGSAFLLWQSHPFRFVIAPARSTKLGDFRAKRNEPTAVITVNQNLNPYHFLITYVHEVAHHYVYLKYRGKVLPHGKEWKSSFQQLMLPFLSDSIFPEDVLKPLKRYMANPKASSMSDVHLATALKQYDEQEEGFVSISELATGDVFRLKKRTFKKLETRRTRYLCQDLRNSKNYLIHKTAMVEQLEC